MSNLEHYFENLLFYGEDVMNGINKKELTPEQIDAVETCAYYVKYTMFNSEQECKDFLQASIDDNLQEWVDKYYNKGEK